jgi:hypothetical protein
MTAALVVAELREIAEQLLVKGGWPVAVERIVKAADALERLRSPVPEAIDRLMSALREMGVYVPQKDAAFFHAVVRRWLAEGA